MENNRFDINEDDELVNLSEYLDGDMDDVLDYADEQNEKHDTISHEDNMDSLSDFDFSDFRGNFKSGMKSINKKVSSKKRLSRKPQKAQKPLSKEVPVEKRAKIFGGEKKIGKVIVPRDREVIVEGVSKFILSNDKSKDVGYYKGRKLKELVLTFNNNSAIDFEIELFNPSMPVDYLQSTSQNLNDKVQVAGNSPVSYSDILFNILANPAMMINAKFVLAGPSLIQQTSQALIFQNKSMEGKEKVFPFQMNLQIDNMQVQSDIIYFDIMSGINRPFIPDGMDIIKYKILAGMTVTFAFYYTQVSLKKVFYKEARNNKGLM